MKSYLNYENEIVFLVLEPNIAVPLQSICVFRVTR
jgi:hypothetical protein